MRSINKTFCAGVSLLALAAVPDTALAEEASGASSDKTIIIVTARRKNESLQDVPQTVNAVTNETIAKLNIQNFQEIQSVVPGLTLEAAGNGFSTTASVRGATFNVETGAKDTVVFYQNEVVVQSQILFSSLFDIGQIELLRGPQGTVRGRSAPSGAITVTTRRPDLSEIGAYVNGTLNTRGDINAHGAIGVPIVQDVLALRVAGLVDHNDFGGVRSVNSDDKPYSRTEAVRVSLRFEPTSSVRANVMYQYMHRKTSRFTQVFGDGAPGGIVDTYFFAGIPYLSRPAPPAGYNGPPIAPSDRLAVQEDPVGIMQTFQVLTGSLEWEFAGQKLSYVGGYSKQSTDSGGGGDTYNSYPGGIGQILNNDNSYTSHELRLSSVERIANIFDYTAGVFYLRESNHLDTTQFQFFPGAFGRIVANPFVPQTLVAPDLTFVAPVYIRGRNINKEISIFGSVTVHIGDRTELTGGVRHITWKVDNIGPFKGDIPDSELVDSGSSICLGPTAFRFPDYVFGGIVFPIGANCIDNAADPNDTKDTAWVWNVSALHHFNDDLMVYASVGTSWRAGPFTVAPHDLDAPGFVSSADLRFHDPEKSTSYEVGLKTSFLNKRGRFDIAVYHQKFKDYFFFSNDTYRLAFQRGFPTSVSDFNYTANADAKVTGVDIDASFQITPNWDISGAFSWAKGQVANDYVPCNDSNFDGVPDDGVPTVAGFVAAGVIVARCLSNESISRSPRWNLSLRSEYAHPVTDSMNAFLRGQFTYYPSNPYRTSVMRIGSYGLLNLYAGLRSQDGRWEVNIFAKNILKESQILDVDPAPVPHREFGAPGYTTVSVAPRREFGLNVRFAIGSR